MIVDEQVVVRNNAEKSLVHVPSFPTATACQTITQYHILDIGIDIVEIQNVFTTTRISSWPFLSHPLASTLIPSLTLDNH